MTITLIVSVHLPGLMVPNSRPVLPWYNDYLDGVRYLLFNESLV